MMAGARIRIEIDDTQARAALDRLVKAGTGFPRTRGDRPWSQKPTWFFLKVPPHSRG